MNFLVLLFAIAALGYSQIIITEVERNPPGSETAMPGGKSHEYIELFNCTNDTFLVDSLSLYDGITTDRVKHRTSRLWYPGNVLLILDPDYFSVASQNPIPYAGTTSIATLNHTSILGGLSSSDGFVVLYGDSIVAKLQDSLSVSERYLFTEYNGIETDGNVLESKGTLSNRIWRVAEPSPGSISEVNNGVFLSNNIDSNAIEISCRSFEEDGLVEIIADKRTLFQKEIRAGQSFSEAIAFEEIPKALEIKWHGRTEERIENVNLSHLRIDKGSIVISEISPRGDVEWIELYNSSFDEIGLDGWSILNDEDTFEIEFGTTITPQGYLLLSKYDMELGQSKIQSNWFSLGNYHDSVYLYSKWGSEDSVRWDSDSYVNWEQESLHRIMGTDGFEVTSLVPQPSTPGTATLLSPNSEPISITCTPQLFSPNSDGEDDSLKISVKKPSYYNCRIRIFSRSGVEMTSFEIEENTGYWDGNAQGKTARRGPYIVLAEFHSPVGQTVSRRSGIVLWR